MKFCVVGATGYAVNLGVYAALVEGAGLHYLGAAVCSFVVAVANNYAWNRLWTFRDQRGHVALQGAKFLVVSLAALGANIAAARAAGRGRDAQDPGAGRRHRARHAALVPREQALVVPVGRDMLRPHSVAVPARASRSASLILGLALVVASLVLVRGAHAETPTAPVYDQKGRLIETPFVPPAPEPILSSDRATELALADPKIADWIARYPKDGLSDEASFSADDNAWTVKVWSTEPDAGQIVLAKVDDSTGRVTEAWTGPQVAWTMARGAKGSFGRKINDGKDLVAAGRCVLPRSREPAAALVAAQPGPARPALVLGVLVVLQRGRDLHLGAACLPAPRLPASREWPGSGSAARGRAVRRIGRSGPCGLLAALTIFIAGFRIGLNVEASNVIDVGYAGVIGAQRIVDEGEMPLRQHARTRGRGVRAGGLERQRPRSDPDERSLRVGQRPRRHLRADQLHRVHPRLPRLRLERQVGRARRPRTSARSCSTASR